MQTKRRWLLAVVLLGLLLGSMFPLLRVEAVPVVDNDAGSWLDDYNDALGVYNFNNMVNDAGAGVMRLAPGQTAGWYDTVLIQPTSFDLWQRVVLEGSYAPASTVLVSILDQNEVPLAGYQNRQLGPGGVLDISGISSSTYPALRVRVDVQVGTTAPVVSRLQVEWHAISRLLLDKSGPATIAAGKLVIYTIRYSVSFVAARQLVLWDPLPREARGTVIYPLAYGQDDQPTFGWASAGGQYCAGPGACNVGGVSVPAYSVYWDLGTVPAGRTGTLTVYLHSPNGALHGTLYRNTAQATAQNAAPVTSNQVETVLTSVSSPHIDERGGAGTIIIEGRTWAGWSGANRAVQFITADPVGDAGDGNSCPLGVGCQTMYNPVLYVDVSDLVNAPAKVEIPIPGDVCSAFASISGGGTCQPAYSPPAGGGPFPAIVWPKPPFRPQAVYYESFVATLVPNPVPDGWLLVAACLDSDQTDPVCDNLQVLVGLDDTPEATFSKGDDLDGQITYWALRNDDPLLYATPGGVVKYILQGTNDGMGVMGDIVMADIIVPGTSFLSAALPPAAGGAIFYATTAGFPDPHVPPPFTYTAAPGDLDLPGNSYWEPYATLTDPSAVTWIAYYLPELNSQVLPIGGSPYRVVAEYDVLVQPLADPCSGVTLRNWGQFTVFTQVPLGGGPRQPIVPPLQAEDWEVTQVKPRKVEYNLDPAQAYFEPALVAPQDQTTYHLRVENRDTPTSDTAYNVRVALQWSQVPVNGTLAYLDFISVTASWGVVEVLDPAAGYVRVNLGTLFPGDQRDIALRLGVPWGSVNESVFAVEATISGTDDECPVPPGIIMAYGQVRGGVPRLQEVKDDTLDVIPSGGLLTYTLRFNNIGNTPSFRTLIFDMVPPNMVFEWAGRPHGEEVYVSAAQPPDLPPELQVERQLTWADVSAYFTPAICDDRGTPGDYSDDRCTSPFGEATTWVAWMVDDPVLGLFPVGVTHQVGLVVRNDEDRGPALVGSPDGTLIFNEAAITADGLLQAIGNEVRTTIDEMPGLALLKEGPAIVCAGETFAWTIAYTNTSWVGDDVVTIRDTLPAEITFVSAQHGWNARALANGADPGNNGQPVPSSVVNNPDGTTTVQFNIADPYRGGDLRTLEGGRITVYVQVEAGVPTGSFLTNVACGEASNITGTVSTCTEDTVEIQNSDLWLRKTRNIGDPRPGEPATWMLIPSNEGLHDATDVVLQDVLPTGMTYVPGSTLVQTAHYTLGEPYVAGQTLEWSVARGNALTDDRLGTPGVLRGRSEDVLITFVATVDGGTAPGTTLTNQTSVATGACEDGAYANTASASVRTPRPDLTVGKTGPLVVEPDATMTWLVRYRNLNREVAEWSYLIDTLPANSSNMPYVTFLHTQANGPNLPVGLYYHVGPTVPRPVFDPQNPLSGGWVASPVGITVAHVAYNLGAMPVMAGPYDVQMTVQLRDPTTGLAVPAGLSLTNFVEILTLTPEDDVTNNTATATVNTPGLDLALEKTGSVEGNWPGLPPGTPLEYTIAFRNLGAVIAYGVWVSDTLPAEVVPQMPPDNWTALQLWDAAGQPVFPVDAAGIAITQPVPITRVQDGRHIVWYLGSTDPANAFYYRNVGVPGGAQSQFAISTQVSASAAAQTVLFNPAEIVCDRREDAEPPETFLDNNRDSSFTVVYRADLRLDKRVQDKETGSEWLTDANSVLTYTVWYNNQGGIAADDVQISEVIPPGTRYIPGSLTLPSNAEVSFWPDGNDPAQFTLHFTSPLAAPATYYADGGGNPWQADSVRVSHAHVQFVPVAAGDFDTASVESFVPLDVDVDGDMDILALGIYPALPSLLLNDGSGQFTKVDAGDFDDVLLDDPNLGVLDANGDGWPDVAATLYDEPNQLYLNDGGTLRLAPAGDYNLSHDTGQRYALVFDANGDGAPDLADLGGGTYPNHLYLNNNDGTGQFTLANSGAFAVGCRAATPGAISLDWDNDGNMDLVVGCASAGTYNRVLRNDGSGYFTLVDGGDLDDISLTVAEHLVAFDANGDGYQDVARGYRDWDIGYRNAGLYLGDGTGRFNLAEAGQFDDLLYGSGDSGLSSECLSPADIDGDHDLDLVAMGGQRPGHVFLNDGAGQFGLYTESPGWWWPTYTPGQALAVFDVDGDGDVDIVANRYVSGVYYGLVFRNDTTAIACAQLAVQGSGWFNTSPDPGAYDDYAMMAQKYTYDVQSLDADGDGDMDLAVGNYPNNSKTSELFCNNGAGVFNRCEAGDFDNSTHNTRSILAFDADGDGDTDLAMGNYNQTSLLFLNNGAHNYSLVDAGQFDDAPLPTHRLIALDADGDGDQDIVVGNIGQANRLYLNNGTGSFALVDAGDFDNTPLSTYDVIAADLDHDGDVDLATANVGATSRVYLNNGTGSFALVDAGDFDDVAMTSVRLIAVDVNGDHRLDLVRGNYTSQASQVYLNNGAASFALVDAGAFDDQPAPVRALGAEDVDGDGDQDLLVGNYQNYSRLYLNDGSGRFTSADAGGFGYFHTVYMYALALTDVDGDSDLDVATGSYAGGRANTIFVNDNLYESGFLTSPVVRPTTMYPHAGELGGWDWLWVEQETPGSTVITYDLLTPAGTAIPGWTGLLADATGRISLAGVDASIYPAVRVRANLLQTDAGGTKDSLDQTPSLCAVRVTFHMEQDPSFTFLVQVDDPVPVGQVRIDNTAAIASSTPEETYANNVATDTIWLRQRDLAVQKAVNQAAALEGDPLWYTIDYRCNGPQSCPGSVLTDTLPVGVAYVPGAATPPEDSLSGSGTPGDPYVLAWALGDLEVADAGTVLLPVTVQAGTSGQTLVNTARVATTRLETRYDNNQDSAATVISSLANVWVAKSGPTWVLVGGTMTYTLDYGSNGVLAADNVVVSDTLPAEVDYVTAVPLPNEVNGQVLRWTAIGTLAPGAGGTITVVVRVHNDPALAGAYLHNVVTIATTTPETTLADNSATWDTIVLLTPASISGYVWNDVNGNVVRKEPGEPGLPGVTVTLVGTDLWGNPVLTSTVTDAAGFYIFPDQLPGTYLVTETQPLNWTSTGAVVGSLGGTIYNADRIVDIPPRSGDVGSEYNFGEDNNPTAVRLLSFTARPAAAGVLLAWETASEHDNAGFNVYRSESVAEMGEQLNAVLIPSRSPGGDMGATYVYTDTTALVGPTYFYRLEDVALNGQRTSHGPVLVTLWRVYLPLVLCRAGPDRQ